jgi:hypothetical protein
MPSRARAIRKAHAAAIAGLNAEVVPTAGARRGGDREGDDRR